MEAIIFDTETTGLDEPEIVQAAWAFASLDPTQGQPSIIASQKYRPSKRISLGALAVHHIMDEDLEGCKPSSSFRLPDGVRYLIGFNIDYDWKAIGSPDVKRIDVCAMCRQLWPEADSHSQAAMLYLLERQFARTRLVGAHDASIDVDNCRLVLCHVLRKAGPFATFEDLWLASERSRIPSVMPFGKHKGMRIADVPRDYRRWLLGQPDVDPYLVQALRAA